MKIVVDYDLCEANAVCMDVCPECFRVEEDDSLTVLIESPALRDQFNRSPAVAATFHYGRGRVLHTMGHYYQEAGNLAGTIAGHRLALNFILEKMKSER